MDWTADHGIFTPNPIGGPITNTAGELRGEAGRGNMETRGRRIEWGFDPRGFFVRPLLLRLGHL